MDVGSEAAQVQVCCFKAPPQHLLDIAVSSGHHPVLIDERTATEVEAGVVLSQQKQQQSDTFHRTACEYGCEGVLTCRDTCQGQE